jgi:amphi-Trp domain-containing protein
MSEEIEVEKSYPNGQAVAKLRRLADALEQGIPFEIQIAGERIYVPPHAVVGFEYEQSEDGEQELEIEVKWKKQ